MLFYVIPKMLGARIDQKIKKRFRMIINLRGIKIINSIKVPFQRIIIDKSKSSYDNATIEIQFILN